MWMSERKRELAREASRRYRARHGPQKSTEAKRAVDRERQRRNRAQGRYSLDPEKSRARIARWRERNAEQIKAYQREYMRRKRREAPTVYTPSLRRVDKEYALVLRGDPCSYCGGMAGEVDHIVPVSLGGGGEAGNLTAACRRCNAGKRDRSLLRYLHAAST